MTAFRNSALGAGLALVLLASGAAGQTQVGPPRELTPLPPPSEATPSAPPAGTASPDRLLRGSEPGGGDAAIEQDDAPSRAPTAPAPPVASVGIQVEELARIDPSSVGLLEPESGGFGLDMWAGAPRSLVERLLPRLMPPARSATLYDLAVRLLTSSATVPEGTPVAPSLLGLRIERLVALGALDEAERMLALAPATLDDPLLPRLAAEVALMQGKRARACELSSIGAEQSDDGYWLELGAYCDLADGAVERAGLTMALLRELDSESHAGFLNLAELFFVADRDAVQVPRVPPTAINLAMIEAAGAALPPDMMDGAAPGALKMVIRGTAVAPAIRVDAAESLARMGAVDPAVLARLYKIYAGQLEAGADSAQPFGVATPIRRARRVQLVAQIRNPVTEVETLVEALSALQDAGLMPAASRMLAETLRAIEPSPALAAYAYALGQAHAFGGRMEFATAWHAAAEQAGGPDAQAAARALWPYLLVAQEGYEQAWSDRDFQRWASQQEAREGQPREERIVFLLGIFDALGFKPSLALWEPLLDGPSLHAAIVPAPALVKRLQSAAAAKRVGETVLLVLLVLDPAEPERIDATTLGLALRALVDVGLTRPAHALALEAMSAAGY